MANLKDLVVTGNARIVGTEYANKFVGALDGTASGNINQLTINGPTITYSTPGGSSSSITIQNATTALTGVVQLNDSTDSNSTSQAATANAVKKVKEYAQNSKSKVEFNNDNGVLSIDDGTNVLLRYSHDFGSYGIESVNTPSFLVGDAPSTGTEDSDISTVAIAAALANCAKLSGANFTGPITGTNATFSGSVKGAVIQSTSDINKKENLIYYYVPVDSLNTYRYNFKDDPEKTKHIGLVAQEVQKIMPEAVSTDSSDGSLTLDYNAVVAMLVTEVKQLKAEIRYLNNEIKSIKESK